ncbi:MAG: CO dehydrogenase/CO-methylating acetyl-CoA synthase complex subunit beta [Oscillospiraceae bacterium]|nr:CO dehydrogenase/CO-methylating acetyl-CoA synthase complex subunit beta [Oscillospiraceae bacterium]
MARHLFDRVFCGSDEMFAKAEAEVNKLAAELGTSAPMVMPSTAYFLSCIYAYIGKKVTTVGELQEALADVKAMMLREPRTNSIFQSGVGTAIAAEMIEACKYARDPAPYGEAGSPDRKYWGHMTDAEVRELGVPLVTGDIPGFVVIIGPAPTTEEAAALIKGYQSRGIFVFLIGGIIDQAYEAGLSMGFPVRVVPVGQDIWAVGHVISLVVRAAMIFGNIQPGDCDGFHRYTFDRINAFVNAFKPVNDITVACGAGAIKLGFPVITNDHDDMWAVPKSLIIYDDYNDWIDTSLEARGIKLKITKIDIPVAYSSAFEGEVIRKADMQVDIYGAKVDCFELVQTKEAADVEDHKIEVVGPELDELEVGSMASLSYTIEVAGKAMQPDFEPVMERKIHAFLNCAEGVMHTGQRDMIRIRISKAAFDAGFRFKHIGEILYAKIKSEFEAVVDKCQVKIVVGEEKNNELRKGANKVFDARDERLKSMTDESVPVFYSCIMCQAFSPSHVCIVTPERLGLCGAVSWLDAKATYELDPNGPCQVVTKERCLDERVGRYEDIDEVLCDLSHGALEHVTLYSLFEDPMTSCGCFECICGVEPCSMGVVITCREFAGMTPLGMTFSEMASMTGGGVQTPGFMGHGKHFIASKKFLKAEGGLARLVWLPSELKEQVKDKVNETAKELYGIENFCDMIADENSCGSGDPEELLTFLSEVGHPVLGLEPFDM